MNKVKDTPNLPGSSRMQMPSTGGGSANTMTKGSNKLSGGGGDTKRVMDMASKKGMKATNSY